MDDLHTIRTGYGGLPVGEIVIKKGLLKSEALGGIVRTQCGASYTPIVTQLIDGVRVTLLISYGDRKLCKRRTSIRIGFVDNLSGRVWPSHWMWVVWKSK